MRYFCLNLIYSWQLIFKHSEKNLIYVEKPWVSIRVTLVLSQQAECYIYWHIYVVEGIYNFPVQGPSTLFWFPGLYQLRPGEHVISDCPPLFCIAGQISTLFCRATLIQSSLGNMQNKHNRGQVCLICHHTCVCHVGTTDLYFTAYVIGILVKIFPFFIDNLEIFVHF